MLKSFIHYHSLSRDPYLNLAFEANLLEKLAGKYILFTYSNKPCVVYGNFQNPWIECNLKEMKPASILPVRRFSGGGAVFHDQGNLNLSFIRPSRDHFKHENAHFIEKFLRELKLPVFVNDRSDLRIKGPLDKLDRKISGSAFKQKKDRSYHHMTLLCQSDLAKLNQYLMSDLNGKITSKSIASVRSVVANLSEYDKNITPDFIATKLSYQCQDSFIIDENEMLRENGVKELAGEMQSWDFIFGKTPKMEFTYQDKQEHYFFEVLKGIITSFEILGSDLHPAFVVELEKTVLGRKLDQSLLEKLLKLAEEPYRREVEQLVRYFEKFVFF